MKTWVSIWKVNQQNPRAETPYDLQNTSIRSINTDIGNLPNIPSRPKPLLTCTCAYHTYMTTYSLWSAMHELFLLPSLFTARLFWTFHNKSQNMKALVILSHSWLPFLPLTCFYGKNELLWVSMWPSGVFSWEKTPLRLPMQITWPWPPVGRFSHGLITVRQKKMWT